MKISKLYIRGFGKLEAFEIDLSNNVNVIFGANESGKSTLMAFIKAALYGLKGGKADKEGQASELRRYKPWNSQNYGGYINFSLDNSLSYRLDREFNNNIVKLFDKDFNDITGIYSGTKDGKGIAEKLTGINETLFERTVYIRQLGTKIDTAASKDLIERISNMGQSGYEDISYKKAYSALKEALRSQVGTERSYTRPMDILNKRLEELHIRQAEHRQEEEKFAEILEKIKLIDQKIAFLTDKEKLLQLAEEFCEVRVKLGLLSEKLEEAQFLSENLRVLHKNINKLSDDKSALEAEIIKSESQAAQLSDQLNEIKSTASKEDIEGLKSYIKALDICTAVSLALFAGSAWGAFILAVLPEYITTIPAGIMIISAVYGIRKRKTLMETALKQAEKQERNELVTKQLEDLHRLNAIAAGQLKGLLERLEIDKQQYEQQKKRAESVNISLTKQELAGFEIAADQLSAELIQRLDNMADMLPKGEADFIAGTMEYAVDDSCKKELQRLRQICGQMLQESKIERATLEVQLQKNSKEQPSEKVEQEIYKLTQQKEALERRGLALQLAMTTLEEASREVQKKFLPTMNRVFSNTFSELTSQRYTDTRAGDNLNIMLSHPGSETVVPVSALSNGTIDQLYLSLRVAVSETVLKGNERVPLILDEPFAQYDDERTENALRIIGELSKKQQIIVFTCKQREVEMLSSLADKYACKICSLT